MCLQNLRKPIIGLIILNIVAITAYGLKLNKIWYQDDGDMRIYFFLLFPFALVLIICNLIPLLYALEGRWSAHTLVLNNFVLTSNLFILYIIL